MRTAYHRNHLREITGPSEEELASGMPLNFIVGGFFPDVPTTKGPYHKGDAWKRGAEVKKFSYRGFRGDADPSNVSGLDDDEAYLPRMGTEWDIGGRGQGFNPNRYISRAPGAFGVRGGFRAGVSLDSFAVPVGAIQSVFSEEDGDGGGVNFSWTGSGAGRGFNPRGLYGASRGSFTRKQGLRGAFMDGNIAQVGGTLAEFKAVGAVGAIQSEFSEEHFTRDDSPMVDFSWTGSGPGRGFNPRGLYKSSRGSFGRKQGLRGSFLDGNIAQVGRMQSTAEEQEAKEAQKAAKRKRSIAKAAQAFKRWAQDELIPTAERFIDADGTAFGYVVSLPSANDQSDATAAAREIARRFGTHFTLVDAESGWDVDGDSIVIFSDDPSAVVVVPEEFSVAGFSTFSAQSGALFKKISERLESFVGRSDVERLEQKVKRLKKQLAGAEAQLAQAKGGEAPSTAGLVGRLAGSGRPFDGSGRLALTDVKYGWKIPKKGRDLSYESAKATSAEDIEFKPSAPVTVVPAATGSSAYDYIEDGDEGPEVADVQRAMNYLIQAGLTVDGDFGGDTEAAVAAFQKRFGLKADGIVGPRTLQKIVELYEEEGTPAPRELAKRAAETVAGWDGEDEDDVDDDDDDDDDDGDDSGVGWLGAEYLALASGFPVSGTLEGWGVDASRVLGYVGALKKRRRKKSSSSSKKRPTSRRVSKRRPSKKKQPKKKGLFGRGRRKDKRDKKKKGLFRRKDKSSSRSTKRRPGTGQGAASSVHKKRPAGLRASPGAKRGELTPEQQATMDALSAMAQMGEGGFGGGGGGDMGGGGGGPSGGGEGGGGSGLDEAPPDLSEEGDDLEFLELEGDEEEEEDPGVHVISVGDEEEEEGEGEEGEDEEGGSGVRVVRVRPGFGSAPVRRGPGRQIGVNPMGQPIYESGRIVLGRIGDLDVASTYEDFAEEDPSWEY